MSNSQTANPTAAGYLGVFAATWMISMIFAGWFGKTIPHVGYLISLIIGGVLPLVTAVMLYHRGDTLDTIILLAFSSFVGLVGIYGLSLETTLLETATAYDGWINALWGIFFLSLWYGTLGRNTGRSIFLLAFGATSLAHAIGHWTQVTIVFLIAGYLGLITSLLAGYISVNEAFGTLDKEG